MTDWALLAARLALYLDLGLLFGIPFFALTAGKAAVRQGLLAIAPLSAALAGAGIVISLMGFALQVAVMSDTDLAHVDPAIATDLLVQTGIGWALIGRIMALAIALTVAALLSAGRAKLCLLMILGGVAVASLVWSGHGASSDGALGIAHTGADIVHLLAASAWIGALMLLLMLVLPRGMVSRERVNAAHVALAGFGAVGAFLVGLIVMTGFVNGAFLVGADGLPMLAGSLYGRLLLVKLLLFAAMLACAAANRFWLTPKLASAIQEMSPDRALGSLRRSVAIEGTFAVLILGLVAWMGTLEPPISGL